VKDEHVKDAAQDVAEGDAHDVAEDVLATPEDGGVKTLTKKEYMYVKSHPLRPLPQFYRSGWNFAKVLFDQAILLVERCGVAGFS